MGDLIQSTLLILGREGEGGKEEGAGRGGAVSVFFSFWGLEGFGGSLPPSLENLRDPISGDAGG